MYVWASCEVCMLLFIINESRNVTGVKAPFMNANDNSAAIYLRVNVDISIYVHMLVAEQEAKVDRSAADAIKAQATQQLTSFDVAFVFW